MSPKRKLVSILAFFLVSLFALPSARAGELAKPKGDVILIVSGNISNTNANYRADAIFSRGVWRSRSLGVRE